MNTPDISELTCIEKLALSESNTDSIIYELLINILYSDERNIQMLNYVLQQIDATLPIISDTEDIVLFLREMHDQNFKDQLLQKIDTYAVHISYGLSVRNLFILLNKVSVNLEDLDTLKLANSICVNNGYGDGKKLNISQHISSLISNELSEFETIKAEEYGNAIINSHKKESIGKIIPVVIIISTLVLSLLN